MYNIVEPLFYDVISARTECWLMEMRKRFLLEMRYPTKDILVRLVRRMLNSFKFSI